MIPRQFFSKKKKLDEIIMRKRKKVLSLKNSIKNNLS